MLRAPGSSATQLALLLSCHVAVGAAHLFDCELGRKNWREVWSKPKQDWCCQYVNFGCASQRDKFTCVGNHAGWSSAKKARCCMDANVACEYDCHVKPGIHWTPKHARWCCKTFPPVGCGKHNQLIYNCHKNAKRWETGWSRKKKAYCCENHPPLGCRKSFDCNAGIDKWATGWSDEKKDFCCREHPPRGCAGSEIFDCDEGIKKWQTGWSEEKKTFCCKYHPPTGCTSGDPFDCNAGLDAWESGWSPDKKSWCCANKKLGCPVNDYNCDDPVDWAERWPPVKKDWCCYHHNPPRGCPSHVHYNCVKGLPASWSKDKQDWCCNHHNLGCKLPFNCSAGRLHWLQGWSEEKQEWCCSHNACPEAFACKVGDWHGWAQNRKDWCCQHYSVGCEQQDVPVMPTPPPVVPTAPPGGAPDCSLGFQQRSTWSKHKTCYCCRKHGIACPPVYYEGDVPVGGIVCDLPAVFTSKEEITPQVRGYVGTGGIAMVLLLPMGGLYALVRWRRKRERSYARAPLHASG